MIANRLLALDSAIAAQTGLWLVAREASEAHRRREHNDQGGVQQDEARAREVTNK